MKIFDRNHTNLTNLTTRTMRLALIALIALVMAACGAQGGGLPDEGNELPTPRPAEEVGAEAQRAAQATPQETWNNYVRDAIAEAIAVRNAQTRMLQRYENPRITEQNVGGLFQDVSLLEDRTEFTESGSTANGQADFDIRITWLDGDTESRTCNFNIAMERNAEDEVWYVLNPQPLPVFSVCN